MKRQKFGDAASGDFKGPWAIYEGMEEFKHQHSADMDENQKEVLKRLEAKR